MMKHFKDKESGKIYSAVSREGNPIKMQRSMHSEEFYVLAMIGLFSATNNKTYLVCNIFLNHKQNIEHDGCPTLAKLVPSNQTYCMLTL